MNDLEQKCNNGIQGIGKLWYISAGEIQDITVSALNKVTVSPKNGARWGEIKGRRTTAASEGSHKFTNRIQTILPGWTVEEAVSVGHLTKGRYLVKWTDKAGKAWICGYGEPLHLDITQTAPDTPTEYQGITLVFSNESEYGFLELLDN